MSCRQREQKSACEDEALWEPGWFQTENPNGHGFGLARLPAVAHQFCSLCTPIARRAGINGADKFPDAWIIIEPALERKETLV
jgi:hypothetical protein